jgi:hypothetical protein
MFQLTMALPTLPGHVACGYLLRCGSFLQVGIISRGKLIEHTQLSQ